MATSESINQLNHQTQPHKKLTLNNPAPTHVIVLNLDGLNANMLGPYGGTLVETMNFNRLGSQSFLFDQYLTSQTKLDSFYSELWGNGGAWINELTQSGFGCQLVTDEETIVETGSNWEKCQHLSCEPKTRLESDLANTELANFFAQATEAVSQISEGGLTWLHSRGLWGSWDAPYALREQLAAAEDPEPPEFVIPSSSTPETELDPDDQLGIQQAWAAQMFLLDEFLGVLLDLIDASPMSDQILFCLTSGRGFPLGEHGFVGGDGSCLFNEAVHTPLFFRLPQTESFLNFRCARSSHLAQPITLKKCIDDWLKSPEQLMERLNVFANTLPDPHRQWAVCKGADGAAIQTQAWKFCRRGEQSSLFVKPDDLWEVNDVSRRCAPVSIDLESLLDQALASSGEPTELEISDVLALGLD